MIGGNKSRPGSAKERSVFVGNIPYDVTEEQLKEVFSEAGSVMSFRLVTDRETGKPKGYGFCEYADGATALSAMRNLNGYEINGRNLRVDFADGGDKSGGGGGGGGGDKGHHHHSHHGHHQAPSVSGEMAISAIEAAIAKFGPLKLYDMLLDLKEHARQKPEYTKSILGANPALTHAIVQAFKTLQIPIPSSTESQPALLAAPPTMGGRPMPPQRGPVLPVGGVLGMAPPSAPAGLMPTPSMAPPPPAKAGGTRWSSRPGPLSQATTPAPSAPVSAPAPLVPPVGGILQPPPRAQGPPPGIMGAPPARNRDPRRRDPRLAKRGMEPDIGGPPKRQRAPDSAAQGQLDAVAELARDMTPEKLDLLPPNERQMLMAFMQQNNIPFQGR